MEGIKGVLDSNYGVEKVRFESETFQFCFLQKYFALQNLEGWLLLWDSPIKASLRQVEIRDGMAELGLAMKDYSNFVGIASSNFETTC